MAEYLTVHIGCLIGSFIGGVLACITGFIAGWKMRGGLT